ncbi:MAG: Plasmid stabilization protein ParE [Caulobacter sp.]|nr:Plasmid stabilization protein ParE [Caulobacter sp.]
MKRVRLSAPAGADMVAIRHDGVCDWGEARSALYLDEIGTRLALIGAHPGRYPLAPELGADIRRIRSGRHILFYREGPLEVIVLRILHEKQDHSAHLKPRP